MKHLSLTHLDSGIYSADSGAFTIFCAGREANEIDYSMSKESIRTEEKKLVASAAKVDSSCVFFLEQEHGDSIVEVLEPDVNNCYTIATADAFITSKPDLALVIRTADCVPVMIFDPVTRCAAAVHSGWKSTAKEISSKTAALLHQRYGASFADMLVYILPAIGADSYEVGREVADHFPLSFQSRGNALLLNLTDAIRRSLLITGLCEENIYSCGIDTLAGNSRFFSHRAGDIQRNLNVMVIREK